MYQQSLPILKAAYDRGLNTVCALVNADQAAVGGGMLT